MSKEGEILFKGLVAYKDNLKILKKENLRMSNQVLSALKTEINSGRTPPYEFNCTLVRTDINNFSYIFSHYPVEEFMSIINEFFARVIKIVADYGGVVSEFIGDEVIFYFKDEDHENSQAMAVSTICDINNLASEFNKRTKKENGYEFIIKSATAHGRLRFGRLVGNYSLSGAVLIETVRMLSHIKEKQENTIYYTEEISHKIGAFCQSHQGEEVELKGLLHPVKICAHQKRAPLSEILNNLSLENVHVLNYYRDTSSLSEMLIFLSKEDLKTSLCLRVVSIMRNFKLYLAEENLVKKYKVFVDSLYSDWINNRPDQGMILLSSAVTLSTTLFDSDTLEKELIPIFDKYMEEESHSRLVANIVDVYRHCSIDFSKPIEKKLITHPNNRIRANTLIKSGKNDLSRGIAKGVQKMLKDERVFYVSSGLFVMGELLLHYKKEDFIFYRTSTVLQRFLSDLRSHLTHSDRVIRGQALKAARKIEDEDLDNFIEKLPVSKIILLDKVDSR